MKSRRNPAHRDSGWGVIECTVSFPEDLFMDLDLRNEQDTFFEAMNELNSRLRVESGLEMDIEGYTDARLCNLFAEKTGALVIAKTFVYDAGVILTVNTNRRPKLPYGVTSHYRTERQYVVRDPALVKTIRLWKTGSVRRRRRNTK